MVDNVKNILKNTSYYLTEKISLHQPSLEQVINYGEEKYLNLIYRIFTARPYDYMVELDDIGQDYQEISDYNFFLSLYKRINSEASSLFFDGCDFSKLELGINTLNDQCVLYDKEKDIIFDELAYMNMKDYLCKLHLISPKVEIDVGNKMAKKMLIKRNRKKLERLLKLHKPFESIYANVISALVNTEGFKYDYQTIWNLSIGQFYDAWYRSNKIRSVNFYLMGGYSGNIDLKKIDNEDLNWIGSLNK